VADDAIAELEQLLREERDAIRRLDGARVLAYAQRKEAIVARLRGGAGSLGPDAMARFRALAPALRHNGVLLAHARDVLRDALCAARPAGAPTAAASPTRAVPPRILSVRG